MKFRKLYWVTEQLDGENRSEVTGVYTSLPDLMAKGFRWCEEVEKTSTFRLSLVKLDSSKKPLGVWDSPDFKGMLEDLQEFVETDEFDRFEIQHFVENATSFFNPVTAQG